MEQQLKYCVIESFREGVKKKADRHSKNKRPGRTYSHSSRKQKEKDCEAFANWLTLNFPEIRWAKELTADHFQAYLDDLREAGATQATLTSRASELRSICKEIAQTYGHKIDFKAIKTPKSPLGSYRTAVGFKDGDGEKIYQAASDTCKKGIELAQCFGLRAEGICHVTGSDIKREKDGSIYCIVRHGYEKGGRPRVVKALTPELGERCLAYALSTPQSARIVPIKPESLERALLRAKEKAGVKHDYKFQDCHAYRKEFAQNLYDQLRKAGKTPHETIGLVNLALGHSAERDTDLLAKYVSDIW